MGWGKFGRGGGAVERSSIFSIAGFANGGAGVNGGGGSTVT